MNRSVEIWSSVELGGFARGLIRELGALGWTARQRFDVEEAAYRGARSPTERLRVRWRSYVSYIRSVRRRLREGDGPAAMIVCTNTFYAPAVAIQAARGLAIPVVHWVFDLFPDVLVANGRIQGGGLVDRGLGRLTRSTFDHAAANVFLGERLLEHARRRYGPVPHGVVIPVGADGVPFRNRPPAERPPGEPLRILYSGNLGRMHETQTLLDLLRFEPTPGWRMEFRGHGAGLRSLREALPSSSAAASVSFGDALPESQWIEAMTGSDIALVTMKPGAEGLVMPSKTYSAMVAGQAILAICPGDSDLAATVLRHDAGWVIEPGDVRGLRNALDAAVARPQSVLHKRMNAFRAGHGEYDQSVIAPQWAALLTSRSSTSPARAPSVSRGEPRP